MISGSLESWFRFTFRLWASFRRRSCRGLAKVRGVGGIRVQVHGLVGSSGLSSYELS